MTRKCSAQMAKAFRNRTTAKTHNSFSDGNAVWLHGHRIIWREQDGDICFSLCGWPSRTTIDRLNTVFKEMDIPITIQIHKFTPYAYSWRLKERHEISSNLPYSVHDFME